MSLYRNRYTPNEVIELVGQNKLDLVFRFQGEEFSQVFFALSKQQVKKYWEKIKLS